MRCLHHPFGGAFVLVSWFRGFVRRRPSIVVVFIKVGVCGGARVSSSSGLLLLFRVSRDDRDGLDDGFLRRRKRRFLHPRLRVRFGRKALSSHQSRIEKERKKKRFGVVRTDGSFATRRIRGRTTQKRALPKHPHEKRGKRRGI